MATWAEHLLDGVSRGDPTALEALRRVLPEQMPGRERQRLRDAKLRDLAAILRTHLPGEARSTLSALLALAGAAIEGGAPLPAAPFHELERDLQRFIETISDMLPLLAANPRTGRRWPCERTIRSAI